MISKICVNRLAVLGKSVRTSITCYLCGCDRYFTTVHLSSINSLCHRVDLFTSSKD